MSEINTLAGDNAVIIAADVAPEITFADLGLAPELLRAVLDEGYTKPTPIQAQPSGLQAAARRGPAPTTAAAGAALPNWAG